jgi:hypothetical protein
MLSRRRPFHRSPRGHPCHDVDLEEADPVGVGDLEEVLGFEYTGVVDKDVDVSNGNQLAAPANRREIGRHAFDIAAGRRDRRWPGCGQPLTITDVPAVARPMPAVEPVTSAILPETSIFIGTGLLKWLIFFARWQGCAQRVRTVAKCGQNFKRWVLKLSST